MVTWHGRMKKLNVIGRQIGRLRYQRGWTQEMLAARLQLAGWIISRTGVSKIENGSVYVPDFRLPCFAQLFGVAIADFFIRRRSFSPQSTTERRNSISTKTQNDGDYMEDTAKLEASSMTERLAYSIQESADMLGVNYFSVYRLIQRGKLKACRALRGKLLVPRAELLKLLRTE